jgi:Leucine-rich repeat (LRR) protein
MNRVTDVRELCRPAYEQLDVLDLGNNKVQEIPIAFVHFLTSLGNLCLINNDLQQLPPLLGFHPRLHTL